MKSNFLQAPVAIGIFRGHDNVVELANDALLQLWGRTETEMIGKPLAEVLPETAGLDMEERFRQIRTTGLSFQAQEQPADLWQNGRKERQYFNFIFHPLIEEHQGITAVILVAYEVTEQVLARKQDEDEEYLLRSLVEESTVATALYAGRELRIAYVNDLMLGYWGKDRSVVGKTIRDALPELEHQPFPDILDGAFASGKTYESPESEAQLEVDGALRTGYFHITYKPLHHRDGEIWGILHMALDVTEQVLARQKIEEVVLSRTKELLEANEALQRTNRELNRSNDHLEEFAHAASHDLKEPIRKIQVFTGRLKQLLDGKLGEEESHILMRIQNAGQRMGLLVDDLLRYSHVSHRPLEKEAIDLNQKMKKILEDLELDIEEKGAIIRLQPLPVVWGYRRQLQQLFQNLISNALKYSRSGVPPEIDLSSHPYQESGKSFHLIEVRDNGIGFEPDYANRIFEMFTRLHGKMEYSGTGIGLAIAKKVAENHGGWITAEGRPGTGSIFRVYLPVLQEPEVR